MKKMSTLISSDNNSFTFTSPSGLSHLSSLHSLTTLASLSVEKS